MNEYIERTHRVKAIQWDGSYESAVQIVKEFRLDTTHGCAITLDVTSTSPKVMTIRSGSAGCPFPFPPFGIDVNPGDYIFESRSGPAYMPRSQFEQVYAPHPA